MSRRPQIMNSRSSAIGATMLAVLSLASASAQTREQPLTANLCEVVASPDVYNKRALTVEGILSPGEHSLALYSSSCQPRAGFNVTVQAVLPSEWESLRNGKRLRKFLRARKQAHVKLSGTFQAGSDPYGPDVAQFRFMVSELFSVEKQR